VNEILLYCAAGLTGVWAVAHLSATRGVVVGFGELSADNRRVITMEWIAEAIALLSVAANVAVVTAVDPGTAASSAVYGVAIATLLVLAGVSLATGFRIAFLPYRLCPFIFGLSAGLIAAGAWL
jgi:hypothetical protein